MKKEKSSNALLYVVLIIAVALILLAIYAWGGNLTIYNIGRSITPYPVTEYLQYTVMLTINPKIVCAGDWVTGSIDSNIPNGVCVVFIDFGTGFQPLTTVNLNSNGDVSTTQQANTPGTATFRAVCCDRKRNCRISNDDYLTVNICATPTPTPPPDKWYCCFAMGVESCYKNGCPPSGYPISGPYSTLDLCAANCGGYEDGDGDENGDGDQQMPCHVIMPAVPENCYSGYCEAGTCTYVPATLIMRARCECKTGFCSVGTVECANKCLELCGSMMSQCGGGSCPLDWRELIGEESCSNQEACDRCCCQCLVPV